MVEAPTNSPVHRLTIAGMASSLRNMAHIMDKAERHAVEHKIELEVLLQARLYPDMYNLLQQVQYVCYISVNYAQHFSVAPAPRVGYDETTWPELTQSLKVSLDYLLAVSPANAERQATKIVPVFFDDTRGMAAVDYAAAATIPNFYFHMVVAYAILRHNGVPLGKSDYLGNLDTVALSTKTT